MTQTLQAVYILTIGIAPLFWARVSGYYGRRPTYLVSLPLYVLGSISVALSQNVAQLFGTRVLQGVGASSVLAVGAGSIGDVFKPTERGRAMGLVSLDRVIRLLMWFANARPPVSYTEVLY